MCAIVAVVTCRCISTAPGKGLIVQYYLIGVCLILLVALVVFLVATVRLKRALGRFSDIADFEKHKADCEAAASEAERLQEEAQAVEGQHRSTIDGLQNEIKQYQQVVSDFKSAAALRKYVAQMSAFAEGCKTLSELDAKITYQSNLADQLVEDVQALGYALESAKSAGDISAQIEVKRKELSRIRQEVLAIEEVKEMQDFGFLPAAI